MATDDFETLWREHHLDQIRDVVAFEQTVTARTFAAAPGPASSFTPPPLPSISLDLSTPAEAASDALVDDPGAHDLRVIGTLGEGGMGKVLLARQRSLARDVAVKVLKPETADRDGALALLREAVVMGGVEHPNIVPVHALGRDDQGRPVLVMKRVEGTSWSTLLERADHPAWAPLLDAHGDRATANLEVLMRVADAAHYAHSRRVVHRDIKPENVMVGAFGEVYLVDWGIAARLERDRPAEASAGELPSMRGTPAFMAPEMLDGDVSRVDARTDVYLLGATLHAALTGTSRHLGATLHAVLFASYLSRPVEYGAEVPVELAELCNQATHPDPERRPQSALEFRRRLTEYVRHRASLTLAAAATVRLAVLRDLAARASDGDPARLHRLAVECRFGFAQALEVWPGNTHARDGLEHTLRLLLEHELRRENLDAARALAHELGDPDPAIEGRLAALAETLRVRREREAAAVEEARETDLSQGLDARAPLLGLVAVGSVLTNVLVWLASPTDDQLGVAHLVTFNVGMAAVVLLGLFVGRRGLMVNRISRQFAAFAALCVVATLAHRVVAWRTGQTSLPAVVAGDLVVLAALNALGAITIRPWLGWLSLCTGALSVVTVLAPSRSLLWYAVGTNAMILLGIYFGWLRARPAKG
ncbi:MAG: serine/threonine-protein kinase [Deltaproteobacteria bacterium]|nr:serine/threonine-protein kinase [Myxococcales bacterium]MDP3218435.1 serine/threonine-protein kinase [Deltaproteobacteria bacterium]